MSVVGPTAPRVAPPRAVAASRGRRRAAPLLALAGLGLATASTALLACQPSRETRRFTRASMERVLERLDVAGLELGDFALDGSAAVVDGDTLRVRGLGASLRLLALDTEEIFHDAAERRRFEASSWAEYKRAMRGGSPRPVKFATPLGEDARRFAVRFFEGVETVRLERDDPAELRDANGRYLAYVWVKRDGTWVSYNLECVRAGYSPYFTKYGRSRRFHRAFLEAQDEARRERRGIWNPSAQGYGDYDERLAWWAERETVVTRFEREAEETPETWLSLARWDALLRLESKVDQEVVVLGPVRDVRLAERGPSVVKLQRSGGRDLDVVFFDRDVLRATGLQFKRGDYVRIKGVVQRYTPLRGDARLQLRVSLPGQVLAPSRELEALLAHDSTPPSGPADEAD